MGVKTFKKSRYKSKKNMKTKRNMRGGASSSVSSFEKKKKQKLSRSKPLGVRKSDKEEAEGEDEGEDEDNNEYLIRIVMNKMNEAIKARKQAMRNAEGRTETTAEMDIITARRIREAKEAQEAQEAKEAKEAQSAKEGKETKKKMFTSSDIGNAVAKLRKTNTNTHKPLTKKTQLEQKIEEFIKHNPKIEIATGTGTESENWNSNQDNAEENAFENTTNLSANKVEKAFKIFRTSIRKETQKQKKTRPGKPTVINIKNIAEELKAKLDRIATAVHYNSNSNSEENTELWENKNKN